MACVVCGASNGAIALCTRTDCDHRLRVGVALRGADVRTTSAPTLPPPVGGPTLHPDPLPALPERPPLSAPIPSPPTIDASMVPISKLVAPAPEPANVTPESTEIAPPTPTPDARNGVVTLNGVAPAKRPEGAGAADFSGGSLQNLLQHPANQLGEMALLLRHRQQLWQALGDSAQSTEVVASTVRRVGRTGPTAPIPPLTDGSDPLVELNEVRAALDNEIRRVNELTLNIHESERALEVVHRRHNLKVVAFSILGLLILIAGIVAVVLAVTR